MDLFDSLYNLEIRTVLEVVEMVNSSKDDSEYAASLFRELKVKMASHMLSKYLPPSSIGSTPTEVDKFQPPEVIATSGDGDDDNPKNIKNDKSEVHRV
ncbi:hypothetical protein QJS10_CPB18g00732 [Acorus calamus]|uniref:Uncharacterized protein n=1 Tax=Acorus calamus TaxID=4465 RepID=A0AAV9CK10_ACOCL|nr:hypothetical protein QJS10_CPB18g00732 [Acorus calamus]